MQALQADNYKKSVHIPETLLYSSSRLDWEMEMTPMVSDYMQRMKDGGSHEGYRRRKLNHAIRIHDKRKSNEQRDQCTYRPRKWQQLCPCSDSKPTVYIGETARNLYTFRFN